MFIVIIKLQSAWQFRLAYAELGFFSLLPLDIVDNIRESGRNRTMGSSTKFKLSHDAHYYGIWIQLL